MPASKKAYTPILALAALLAGGCEMSIGNLSGRASDEWTRTYQLTKGGELEIVNTNGRVDVEGTDDSTVEVRAERIAKAATDDGARELLPRISIRDDAKPDHIRIETERMAGVMIGASFEVRYHVKAPKTAAIHATNSNGQVVISGVVGPIVGRTTNGAVTAHDVSGPIEAGTTNGAVNVDVVSLTNPVKLSTTNGAVVLTIPDDARADLTATVTNGGISVTGVKLETTEQSRRRVEGKIKGGGQRIDLHTTNGGIRVRGKSAADAAQSKS
jgi:hypothetical protein